MGSDSYVFRLIYALASYLLKVLYGSSTYRVLKRLADWFRKCFRESRAIVILKREGKVDKIWDKSKTYKLFFQIMHLPAVLIRKLFVKKHQIFEHSKMFRLITLAADNVHIISALALFIILIIPHSFWYNIFGTLMAMGLLFLLYVRVATKKDEVFNLKYIGFYLAVFMLSVLLAQIFSIFPALSLRFLVFNATCLIFAFVLINSINSKDQLVTVIEIIFMGVTIVGLYAIYQAIRGVPVNASQTDLAANAGMPGRAYSTMENPNNLGQILMMMLPFYVAIFMGSKSFIKRFIIFGFAMPPLIALGLTYSRSSWIGFAVAMFMFVVFTNWRLIPLFILGGIAAIPVLPQSIYNRILTIFTGDSSVGYRGLIFATVEPMLEKYWFSGVGLGTDVFMSIVRNYPLHTGVVPPHTHNLYLQIWIETGLVGIVVFLGFMINAFKRAVKTVKIMTETSDNYVKYIIIAGVSSLAGILTVGLAEYIWYYPRVMIIFWVVVGLLFAANKIAEQEKHGQKQGDDSAA